MKIEKNFFENEHLLMMNGVHVWFDCCAVDNDGAVDLTLRLECVAVIHSHRAGEFLAAWEATA